MFAALNSFQHVWIIFFLMFSVRHFHLSSPVKMEAGGLATVDVYWYVLKMHLVTRLLFWFYYAIFIFCYSVSFFYIALQDFHIHFLNFVEKWLRLFFLNLPSKVSLKQKGMVLLDWSKTVVLGWAVLWHTSVLKLSVLFYVLTVYSPVVKAEGSLRSIALSVAWAALTSSPRYIQWRINTNAHILHTVNASCIKLSYITQCCMCYTHI